MPHWIDWTWLQDDHSQTVIGIIGIVVAILLFDRIFKHILKRLIRSVGSRDRKWMHYFLRDDRFVFWVLCLPYLMIVHQGLPWISNLPPTTIELIRRVLGSGFIFLSLLVLTHFFRIVNQIYSKTDMSRQRPIKGYLQGVLIVAYMLGFICILAVLLDKSPLLFLSGLGALTAVLLLVFKDSILSLVAGVQLTANDLVRVGDWIEMPQFNADGDVTEIALHSVKVQNWDKTTTVIPAHKFLENSFKNWRGMQDSGGRRIKRSLLIDMSSIKFLDSKDIEKLSRIKILESYLREKSLELREHNEKLGADEGLSQVNFRSLTNIGTFRKYVSEYLRAHPMIRKDMTFLVRQLDPESEGLPLQIYVFVNDIRWTIYENVQSDVFDHLLAVIPEFDLRVYQKPSGHDFESYVPHSCN